MPQPVKPRRALLSVSDKNGIVDFASALIALDIEVISTGGTAKLLKQSGLSVTDISDVTGFPEMMGGRVKTLHPNVHGGLLGQFDDPNHREAADKMGIEPIDLVAITLYPFEKTVAGDGGFDECIEQIDIGGPAMIRSAAKNHARVTVVTDSDDYDTIISAIKDGGIGPDQRRTLAAKAFRRTAAYDAAIDGWFARELDQGLPDQFNLTAKKVQDCRYGENPHQQAGFYHIGHTQTGLAGLTQVQGKALSYNNIADTDAAFELVSELDSNRPAVAIIKHANPCGVAYGETLLDAYKKALACDPVSAFGGIIALNQTIDQATAAEMTKIFTEVIIAPGASDEARAQIAIKKNLRLLLAENLLDSNRPGQMIKTVAGGLLIQDRDSKHIGHQDLTVVTERQPSNDELSDMLFAFTVAKHVKSNAIVYVRDQMTVGVGAGQMNRRDSSRIAALRASEAAEAAGETKSFAQGSVVASDAFFPFADGLLAAVEAGAKAVIQPGGSIRDDEVIKAANDAGIAMVFTGCRHFRH